MKKDLHWYDYLTINSYWFALTARAQTLTPLVIPLLVQQFVGDELKGTYTGIIRLWSLMAALLLQALMGLLSDRSTHRWGRRRPFILVGALMEIIVFFLIVSTINFEGMTGYATLFILYILSMVASNIGHAATQGLIPDLVPDEQKGIASGVKALFELPLPLIFVSFVIGKMIAAGNMLGGIIALSIVVFISMAISMFSPEKPLTESPPPIDWGPITRLLAMTAAFTAIILGTGWVVQQVTLFSKGLGNSSELIIVGIAGLLGMGVATILGVWLGMYAGLGDEIKNNSSFTWWVVSRLAFMIAAVNLAGFIIFYLQEKFPEYQGHKAADPAAEIVMLVGIFILLAALPGGWLADRFGKKRLVAVSGVLGAVGTAVVVLAPTLAIIKIGGCLFGAAVGFFYSSSWALGTSLVPKDKAGQYMGLSNLAGAGAGAVGAYIGGPIADNISYTLLMAIFGAVALISVVALKGIKTDA